MEYHVRVDGNDQNSGSASEAFKTISKASQTAQAGDTITVHEGIYRELVNPPGGGAEEKRIIYKAAPGEKVTIIPEMRRFTPYHFPHKTEIMGVMTISGGDVRFYNNLFIGDKDVNLPDEPADIWTDTPIADLQLPPEAKANMPSYIRKPLGTSQYDDYPGEKDAAPWLPVPGKQFDGFPDAKFLPVFIKHNVYLKDAKPCIKEPDPVVNRECGVDFEIDSAEIKITIKIADPSRLRCPTSEIITTELLGKNHHTEMLYEGKDGTPYELDRDFFGKKRSVKPTAGPFEVSGTGPVKIVYTREKN
jgi:hypothetical protein